MNNIPIQSLPLSSAETPFGRLTYLTNDDPIGKSLRIYGEWAKIEIDFLASFISRGDTVVDIGANIGTHTTAFASAVGATGRVIAYEPQPVIFQLLSENIKTNGFKNIEAIEAGVGRAKEKRYFTNPEYDRHENFGGVSLHRQLMTGSSEVAIVSLDEFELGRCNLIKIDAEGMEHDVLLGMISTVRRCLPVLFFECNTINTGIKIMDGLSTLGYEFRLVAAASYSPHNYAKQNENIFGSARERGLLCLPIERNIKVPASTHACAIRSINTVDEFAALHLAVPQYGDESEHDRDPPYLRDLIRELRRNLETYHADLARVNFRAKSLDLQLVKALQEVEQLEERLRSAEETIRSRDLQIAQIYGSTSWFVTKPLRFLGRIIRMSKLLLGISR